jgi:hypothetical protein
MRKYTLLETFAFSNVKDEQIASVEFDDGDSYADEWRADVSSLHPEDRQDKYSPSNHTI